MDASGRLLQGQQQAAKIMTEAGGATSRGQCLSLEVRKSTANGCGEYRKGFPSLSGLFPALSRGLHAGASLGCRGGVDGTVDLFVADDALNIFAGLGKGNGFNELVDAAIGASTSSLNPFP